MPTLWEKITSNAKLISLPDIYLNLRSVLDAPNFSMPQVAEVIDKDPALTARLLRLVNSAFFGLAARIDTVSRAVSMLGTQQVHDLVLATSVADTFSGMSSETMDMPTYWQRSIHCGVLARSLALECNVLDSERLFVAGMLRDIGHLIMYQSIPDLAQQAMTITAETGQPLFKVEQELIGLDYARVGGALMRQWNLPESLRESTEFHVEPARARDYPLETGIVHLAALMTQALDSAQGPNIWQTRVDVAAWHATGLSQQQCAAALTEADEQVDQVARLIFPEPQRAAL